VRPLSIKFSIDGEGYKNYTCEYEATVTDPYEAPLSISTATGVPLYGDTLTFGTISDAEVECNGKDVSPILVGDTNLQRHVVATFTNRPSNRTRSGNNVVASPLNVVWKKSGSFAVGTRVTSIDKDGDPIITSGLETKYMDVPDGYDTLHLEGPSATLSLTQRAQAVLRCNSATIWTGLTARMVFLAQWQWEELFYQGTSYFYHRLEFWIKYTKWNEFWIDEGTQQYIAGNPVGKRIVPIIATNDSLGKQVKFLDGSGLILADNNIPAGIVTNEHEVIPEFDFTVLTGSIGMPNPLPGNFV